MAEPWIPGYQTRLAIAKALKNVTTGPQGPPGATGAAGPTGPTGPAGGTLVKGLATLVAGAVTVTAPTVTAVSYIKIYPQNDGCAGVCYPANIVVGVGFDIKSTNPWDIGTVLWEIQEP